MEQVTLAFQERKELKKSASRRLRLAGKIPAVVYGQSGAVSISVDAHEFGRRFAAFGENTVIKLENGKTSYEVLVKDFQDDILSGKIQHIDFYHVSATKTLHAKVPVHLTGSAVGVRNGGLLELVSHDIEVECLAKDIPHDVKVDVSALDMNDGLYVRDLSFPAGVKVLTNPDAVVVHVISTRTLDSVPDTEVTTSPATDDAAAAAAASTAAAPAGKSQEKKSLIRLVVGLGNPGLDYARTRHNAGFWFVERWAGVLGLSFKKAWLQPYCFCRTDEGGDTLVLVKPLTFMNHSGLVFPGLFAAFRATPEDLLVVFDQMDLSPGRIRMKPHGSSAGHNGLKSIDSTLGDGGYHRLAIGVGRPSVADGVIDHVLGEFSDDQRTLVETAVGSAVDKARILWKGGWEPLIHALNQRDPSSA